MLQRYLACAPGARSHIALIADAPVKEFDELAPQYPIFRVGVLTQRAAWPGPLMRLLLCAPPVPSWR